MKLNCLHLAIVALLLLFMCTTLLIFVNTGELQFSQVHRNKMTTKLFQSTPVIEFSVVETNTQTNPLPNPQQASKYAYVTLISGIDQTYRYRGFLCNAMIMKKALQELGSTADFIAMIGYNDNNVSNYIADMNLLRAHGISTYILSRLVDSHQPLSFAEMALLKITPWSFIQYDKVQFFDGDVMPTKNMDCFFELNYNTFTVGAVSPLNSGWYLAIPDQQAFSYMREKAIWRLQNDWNKQTGWREVMPSGMFYRGGKELCTEWEFNGADMDQGLLLHYFIFHTGKALLIDTDLRTARLFSVGLLSQLGQPSLLSSSSSSSLSLSSSPPLAPVSIKSALSCCSGMEPTRFFAHFTGRGKPWLMNLSELASSSTSSSSSTPSESQSQSQGIGGLRGPPRPHSSTKNNNLLQWLRHLDQLQLPDISSRNIHQLNLGSALGYFNANFPKGGYTAATVTGARALD